MWRKRIILTSIIMFGLVISYSFGVDSNVYANTRTAISTATVVSTGDILIDDEILNSCKQEDGTYIFNDIFKYLKSYVEKADYAVVNLETSIGGVEAGPYVGFPKFNTPDSILDATKNAGFKMYLTASNHTYDLGDNALIRRQRLLKSKNLSYIGTKQASSDKNYKIVNVNGIKIGMINWTRETTTSTRSKKIINSLTVSSKSAPLIESFNYNDMEYFYYNVKNDIKRMKNEGADIIVAYPHWGVEYRTTARATERKMARRLCDLGVDVIIGGHPHVIEPIETIQSTNKKHNTICLYSMGNLISNQRYTGKDLIKAYTEDGVLFSYTVTKYSDGTSKVTKINALPLWVQKETVNEKKEYTIIPLDKTVNWQSAFGISKNSTEISSGAQSLQRTEELLAPGISKFNRICKILKQPQNLKVKAGKTVSFTVTPAYQSYYTYKWQYSKDKIHWYNSTSKSANKLKLYLTSKKSFNKRYYRCVLRNGQTTQYTIPAQLTVY